MRLVVGSVETHHAVLCRSQENLVSYNQIHYTFTDLYPKEPSVYDQDIPQSHVITLLWYQDKMSIIMLIMPHIYSGYSTITFGTCTKTL